MVDDPVLDVILAATIHFSLPIWIDIGGRTNELNERTEGPMDRPFYREAWMHLNDDYVTAFSITLNKQKEEEEE